MMGEQAGDRQMLSSSLRSKMAAGKEIEVMRRPSILMLAAILLINVGSPTAFCALSSNQKSNPVAKHCKMGQATTVLPCCHQDRATTQTFGSRASASTCCRLSPALPNRPAPTLPALLSEGFKAPVQVDFQATSFWPQTFRASADFLSSAFLANRSGTYLQLSALRI